MVSRPMMARLMGTMWAMPPCPGDEEGKGGLRAVSRGAEGVQAEDGDTGEGAYVLGTLFRGCQGLSCQQTEKGHVFSGHSR